jgi:hypothetical protein
VRLAKNSRYPTKKHYHLNPNCSHIPDERLRNPVNLDICEMDPVTGIQLAASVAELAILAFNLFSNLHKYYRNVKEAPKRSAEVRSEIKSILDLVGTLEEMFESKPTDFFPSLANETQEIHELLTVMFDRTKPAQTRGIQRLKWPFQEHENAEYISKIARYRANMSLALNIRQTYFPFPSRF